MRATPTTTDEATARTIPWTRVLGLAAILLTAGLIVAAGAATAAHSGDTIVVDDDGDDDFESISRALSHAAAGDTVVVQPGEYLESVDVTKDGITLCSTSDGASSCDANPANTVLTAQGLYSPVVDVAADDVTVQGFQIEVPSASGTGIDASQAASPTLEDNQVHVGASSGQLGLLEQFAAESNEGYYEDPFVKEQLGSDTLRTIHEDHADDEGFLGAAPIPADRSEASVDHIALIYEGTAPDDVEDEPASPDRPALRVYEDNAVEEQMATIDADKIVNGQPKDAPDQPTPGPVEGIGPGSFLLIDRPDVDPGFVSVCTSSFIAQDTSGQFYMTTAGHCVLESGMDSFYDPAFSQEGTTVNVCRQPLVTSGTFFCLNGQVELGDVAYARQQAPDGTQIGRDFAAVEIPNDLLDQVRPWMWLWGSPTAVDDGPDLGEEVVHYGHGILTGPTVPFEGRAGVSLGPDLADGSYFNIMAVTGGDSGSGVATSTTPTAGDQTVGDQAFGILTHGIGIVPTGLPGIGWGTTAQQGLDMAANEEGLSMEYVLEDEPITVPNPDLPLAPENVTAVDQSTASNAEVLVEWDINGTSPIVSDVHVYRDGTKIATVSGGQTSYLDEDPALTEGTEYCYQVEAENSGGTSPLSEQACAVPTLADVAAPNFVHALDRGTGDEVQLVWGHPGDSTADSFTVKRILDGTTVETFTTDTGDNRSLLDRDLTEGTAYTYEVQAHSGGETSDAASATVTPTQDAPDWRQSRGSGSADGFTGATGDITLPSVASQADVGGPVASSPVVADLDDDPRNEIVVAKGLGGGSTSISAVAYEATEAGLVEEWRYDRAIPISDTIGDFARVAIADLDGDGSDEVVLVSQYTSPGTYNAELAVLDGATGDVVDSISTSALDPLYDVPVRVTDLGTSGEHVLVVDGQFSNVDQPNLNAYTLEDGALSESAEAGIASGSTGGTQPAVQAGPAIADAPGSLPSVVLTTGHREGDDVTQGADRLHACTFSDSGGGLSASCSDVTGVGSFSYGLSAGYVGASDKPSAIVTGFDGSNEIRVVDLDDGSTRSTATDPSLSVDPGLADLTGDGLLDLAANANFRGLDEQLVADGSVFAYDAADLSLLGSEERPGALDASQKAPGGPVVADVDGDGTLDALLGDESGNVVAVSLQGLLDPTSSATLWQTNVGGEIQAPPALADVTGDGDLEVLAATTDGQLAVVDDAVGAPTKTIGVELSGASEATLAGSTVSSLGEIGSAFGVVASGTGAPGATLASNSIDVSATGVHAGGGSVGMLVEDNEIHVEPGWCSTQKLDLGAEAPHRAVCDKPNVRGVQVDAAVTVRGNSITSDPVAVDTEDGEVEATGTWGVNVLATDAIVEDNTLSGWGVAGVIVWGEDATIEANTFTENSVGVHTSSDPGETALVDNQFEQNGWAVRFAGSAPGAQHVELRENDLADNAHALWLDNSGMRIDARLNDWGVYDADLIDARMQDDGQDNTVLKVPFQLSDGTPEPGLVRIAGEVPSYLSVGAALDDAQPGDTVLVPASSATTTTTVRTETLTLDTEDVRVCGSVTGTAACTSEIEPGHQQLSRAEWADAPGLGSGEAALFDDAGTAEHRSTSYFPPEDAPVEHVDAFGFDYYLAEGTCDDLDVYGQLAVDQTPDDGTHDRDELIYATPSLDDCEQGAWFHVDLMDAEFSYAGVSGSYQDVVAKVNENHPDGDYEISAVNVVQNDGSTVGYVDNQRISDVVLGERQDVACGTPDAEEACRQETAVERTVVDGEGEASQTATLLAPGTSLSDLTVKNTDRPADNTGTVLLDADDTALTGARVVGNHPHEDGTVWGDEIGVQVDDADGYTVADNTIEQWSNMGVFVSGASAGDGVVADNLIRENTNHAIYVGGAAPDTTVEITDNEVGVHHGSALRLANFDRDHVVRDNDFSGAAEQALLVTEHHDDRTLDLRGNDWGVVREELVRERITDAGDHEILVVPYLDSAGDQHPPRPEIHCFTEDADGNVTLSKVDDTLSFQGAVDAALPNACLDRDDNGDEHRTIVLGEDIEEYRGATIDTETTVLSDLTGFTRHQTDGVLAGGARIQAQNGAPAIEIVEGSLDTSIEGISVQGEPVGADGIVIDGAEGPIAVEDVRVGVREAHMSRGLVVEDTPNVRVSSSVFLSGQPAIEATRVDDLTIEDSSIAAAPLNVPETTPEADAIRVTDATSVTVDDNTIHGANAGDSTAIRLTSVEAPQVTSNLVLDSAHGITLAQSTDATVEDNVLVTAPSLAETTGLRMVDGSGHDLARNLLSGTSTAISLNDTPGVTSQQEQTHLATTGIDVSGVTAQDGSAPQFEAHNASLAATTTPLVLAEDTQGLELDMTCNDWGAYQADLIEARISDEGIDNTVDYEPWTSATVDPSSDCLIPPEADFSAEPTEATRLDDIAFTDESEPGSRPIVDWTWEFGDGEESTEQHPTHSYDEVGTFTVVLTVEDTDGMVSRATGEITIENIAPDLDDVQDRSIHHSEDLEIGVTASDAEDDPIALSSWEAGTDPKVLPENAEFEDNGDGTGLLTWDPAPDQYDTYPLAFEADDGQPSNNTDAATAEVVVTNAAPVLEGVPDQIAGAETREVAIDVFAEETDPDTLDDLSVDDSQLPDNATFTVDTGDDGVPNEGTLTWTPGLGEAGSYEVTFTAEGPGHTTSATTTIDIGEEVPPPDLTLSGPSEAAEGTEATVTADADVSPDAPQDPVAWNVTAEGVLVVGDDELRFDVIEETITEDGNTVTWTGTMPTDADRVEVTFEADDGLGAASATHTIDVQLHPELAPQSPTELSTGLETGQPIFGEALEFSAEAEDEDGSLTSITLQPSEAVAALEMSRNAQGVWTATLDDASSPSLAEAYPEPGTYTLTYTAVDDDGLVTEETRPIMVLENTPPEVEVTPDEISGVAEDEDGLTVSVQGTASDPEHRILDPGEDFEWVLDGETVATGARASFSVPVGHHPVELQVTDPYGATGTSTVDVYVQGFIEANGTLENADERLDEDTYRYGAGTNLLEQIEGIARVLDDQGAGAADAAITVNATYYGTEANNVGLQYSRTTKLTNVTGHAVFELDQQLFGQAGDQSVASLPGYHEVTISASWEDVRDVPDDHPDITDLYQDEHTIGVVVGAPMPGDAGGGDEGSEEGSSIARAEASGACYYDHEGAEDSVAVFVGDQTGVEQPDPANVEKALTQCLKAPQNLHVPGKASYLRATASVADGATVVTVDSVPVTDVATGSYDERETTVEGEGACYYDDGGAEDSASAEVGGEEHGAAEPPGMDSVAAAVEACLTAASQGQTPDGGSSLSVTVEVLDGALRTTVDTVPVSDQVTGEDGL